MCVALPLVMMIPDTQVLRKSTNEAHRRSRSMTVRLCHMFSSIYWDATIFFSVQVHVSWKCVRVRRGRERPLWTYQLNQWMINQLVHEWTYSDQNWFGHVTGTVKQRMKRKEQITEFKPWSGLVWSVHACVVLWLIRDDNY